MNLIGGLPNERGEKLLINTKNFTKVIIDLVRYILTLRERVVEDR